MERKFYPLRSRTHGSSSLQEGRVIPTTSVPAALSPSEGPVIPAPPALSPSQTPVTRCDTSVMEQKVYPARNHNTDPSSLQTGMQRRISTMETLIRIKLDKEEEPITLRMQNQFETAMQSYRTGRTVALEVVFQDYCELKGFVYEHVRFLFDGKRVQGNDTAEKFEMDDDDIIHVMSDQIAGGGASVL